MKTKQADGTWIHARVPWSLSNEAIALLDDSVIRLSTSRIQGKVAPPTPLTAPRMNREGWLEAFTRERPVLGFVVRAAATSAALLAASTAIHRLGGLTPVVQNVLPVPAQTLPVPTPEVVKGEALLQ